MNTLVIRDPVPLSAGDICHALGIDARTFESIRSRAPSPFGEGGKGFQKQVLSNMRSPTDIKVEQLGLTLFPEPTSSDNHGPIWNSNDVDAWRKENQGKL